MSAAAHLVISARYQATDIPNAGPELVANPHVLKRWRGGRAAGARRAGGEAGGPVGLLRAAGMRRRAMMERRVQRARAKAAARLARLKT